MENDLSKKIDEQQVKIDAMYKSVETLRKYFLWTFWVTIALFVLPLIGLMFVLPSFLTNYVGGLQSAVGAN